jgi:hypothetical protein
MYVGCIPARQDRALVDGMARRVGVVAEVCGVSQGVSRRDPAGPAVSRSPGHIDWRVSASNPRDVEAALAWQLERVGSTAWRDWSLKFQRMAFGYSQDAGWHDAAEASAWLGSHDFLYTGVPPRGALVWHTADVTRVACSLGRGQVIGALPDVGVAVVGMDELSEPYLWSAPLFPFAH